MYYFFFFSSRRRHTRCSRDWSSDVCSSDLVDAPLDELSGGEGVGGVGSAPVRERPATGRGIAGVHGREKGVGVGRKDRKSTRLNSSHGYSSYAVFCLKKKNKVSSFGHCVRA